MGNHVAAGVFSESRRSSCSSLILPTAQQWPRKKIEWTEFWAHKIHPILRLRWRSMWVSLVSSCDTMNHIILMQHSASIKLNPRYFRLYCLHDILRKVSWMIKTYSWYCWRIILHIAASYLTLACISTQLLQLIVIWYDTSAKLLGYWSICLHVVFRLAMFKLWCIMVYILFIIYYGKISLVIW